MQGRKFPFDFSSHIVENVCKQLSFDFYWRNPIINMYLVYESLPCARKNSLITKIQDEIENFILNIQLSPTQMEIFNQLSSDERVQLSRNIAGTIETEDNFNIVTHQGMKMSGIASVYFEGFQFLLSSIRSSDNYNVFKPKPDTEYGVMPATVDGSGLVYNELGNERICRHKAVIKNVFIELQKFATNEQRKILFDELTSKKNPDVRFLAQTRGFLAVLYPYSHTKSVEAYENSLLDSIKKYPDLIPRGDTAPASSTLPKEVHQLIAAMLEKKDLVTLACLNKKTVSIFKVFIKELENEKNQLRQNNITKGY